jgi:hypothetical protein
MPTPDQAKAALEPLRIDDGFERKWARVKKLPKSLAARQGFLVEVNGAVGYVECAYGKIVPDNVAAGFDSLSGHERSRVFDALLPGLGRQVESAWQLLRRLPYEFEYTRKAFRAPNDPAATRPRRMKWLQSVFLSLAHLREDTLTPAWIAAWAPYLDATDDLGYLLGAVIDAGGPEGDEVFAILRDSAAGSTKSERWAGTSCGRC